MLNERTQLAVEQKKQGLISYLDRYSYIAIAVSGGVDSMVLAYIAHRFSRAQVDVFHAHSPAVPKAAFERIKLYADTHGWSLICLNANELADSNYVNNPVNRCFFCKSQLFSHIRAQTEHPICSGTNLDDLSDYRPGLEAAKNHNVLQPYVEAGINKTDIYGLAQHLALTELESLPAQPCLASRVETDIAITTSDLHLIDQIEQYIMAALYPQAVVRCRITHGGVFIELGNTHDTSTVARLKPQLIQMCGDQNRIFAGVRPYKKGAAFIHASR